MAGLGAPLIALVGALAAAALLAGRPLPAPRWLGAAALGPALGLGTLSLAYFGWRLAGGSSASFAPLGWSGLVLAALTAGRRLARRRAAAPGGTPVPGCPVPGHPVPESRAPWPRVAAGGLLVTALFTLVAGAFYTRQLPYGRFDAWAIWTGRARLLHRAEAPGAAFAELRRAHPDYPFFLPGSLAAQFAMLGGEGERIAQSTGALLLFAAAAGLAFTARAAGGGAAWAAGAAALFLATPAAAWWGFAQCADVPLAYLLVLAAASLVLAFPRPGPAPVPPVLAGFVLGLLPWTKNEGSILAGLLAAIFAASTVGTAPGRRRLGAVLAGALPGAVAVLLLRLAWAPRTDVGHFASGVAGRLLDGSRWSVVLAAFRDRLDPLRGFADWGIVWLLAAAGLAAALLGGAGGSPASGRAGGRFLRWSVAAVWAAWLGVFLGTPLDPAWQIRTALDRLLLQLLPLTLAAGLGALGPPEVATAGLPAGRQPEPA